MSESDPKDSTNKKEEEKGAANSIKLTIREVRKLEKAAEAGDEEAQKKLASFWCKTRKEAHSSILCRSYLSN